MEEVLENYQSAQRDIHLGSIPELEPSGNYNWSQGQLAILEKEEFQAIRNTNAEALKTKEKREEKLREMVSLSTSHRVFDEELDYEINNLLSERNTHKTQREFLHSQLLQKRQDLANRGFYLPTQSAEEKKQPKPKRNTRLNRKKTGTIILIGLGIEGLLLAIQYEALREDLSLSGIIIRSAAMLALLVFFHIIAEINKRAQKLIYKIYLGFNLLMVAAMLFLPPVLFHFYPSDDAAAVENLWSFEEDNLENTALYELPEDPGLVEYLKKNQWTPVGLCTLFFLIVFFAIPEGKKSAPRTEKNVEVRTPHTDELSTVRFLEDEVTKLVGLEQNLNDKISELKAKPTGHLLVDKKLDELMVECEQLAEHQSYCKAKLESLLASLYLKLKNYQTDFLDILKNDETKRAVFQPKWPHRQHILNYYRIQLK